MFKKVLVIHTQSNNNTTKMKFIFNLKISSVASYYILHFFHIYKNSSSVFISFLTSSKPLPTKLSYVITKHFVCPAKTLTRLIFILELRSSLKFVLLSLALLHCTFLRCIQNCSKEFLLSFFGATLPGTGWPHTKLFSFLYYAIVCKLLNT